MKLFDSLSIPESYFDVVFSKERRNSSQIPLSQLEHEAGLGFTDVQYNSPTREDGIPLIYQKVNMFLGKGKEDDLCARGSLHEQGCGVKKSRKKAIYYYEQAVKLENSIAMHRLASLYAERSDIKKYYNLALHYYELASKFGNLEAILDFCDFTTKNGANEDKAFYYLKLCVQNEFPTKEEILGLAQFKLGNWFENGIGVDKSEESALHYYNLSSANGNRKAAYRIALAKLKGELGFNKSDHHIPELLKSAYENQDILIDISCYLLDNKILVKHVIEYLQLMTKLKENKINQSIAEYMLAFCYQKGLDVKQSIEKALYYYRLASENGHYQASFTLYKIYLRGDLGLEISHEKAIFYLKLAADQGLSKAQSILGRLYEKAVLYFKLAADEGLAKAQAIIRQLFENRNAFEYNFSEAIKYWSKRDIVYILTQGHRLHFG